MQAFTCLHTSLRIAVILTGAAIGSLLVGCSEGSGTDTKTRLAGELILTGSSTAAPIVTQIARRFEKHHPTVRVAVQAGGSARGIADAKRGTADIGMSSRDLYPEEARSLTGHPFARDGVAIIVHHENPVAAFRSEEVIALFTGRIENWQALGGPNWPVSVIHKSAGRATRAVFLEHFDLAPKALSADALVGSNQQAMQTVAGERGAVGYVSIGHAQHEINRGLALQLADLEGVAATIANVANGRYPITRPLILVTPHGALSERERAFIAFARSPKVHELITEFGYVPIDR